MGLPLSEAQASAEIVRRRRMRESLVGFAESILIPGAPLVDDGDVPFELHAGQEFAVTTTLNEIDELSVKVENWAREKAITKTVRGEYSEIFAPIGSGLALHHRVLCEEIQKCMQTRYGRLMVFMPPGSAKALALDTPIPTPDGWKSMLQLKVGDQVFGKDGKPCNVTWKSEIFKNRPVYNVVTDCGDVIVADRDHEWLVRLCGKRPVHKIKETWELCRRRAKRPMIEGSCALELPESELPIDPYVLGIWLGDGNSEGGRVTCSVEDQKFIRPEIERLGYSVTSHSVDTNFGLLGIRKYLSEMMLLHNKHIPDIYMRSSVGQRMALLQGLIDSDGTVCQKRGCTTFCNTNKKLALQVRELVRTFGVKAGWSESRAKIYGKDCGAAYKVSFYLTGSARLPRKRELTRNQYRTPGTYIDVYEAGYDHTVCIEVDSPDHMFLCGKSMTPTHNSTYATVIAPTWAMGKWPGTQVILASYATPIAKTLGSRGRFIVEQNSFRGAFNATIDKRYQAKEMWALDNGSSYMSGGLLSGLTGNRARGVVIDDPVKGRQAAESKVERERTLAAFQDDLTTRLIPGAWQILIQTRWSPEDLAGGILPEDYHGQSGPVLCRDGMVWNVLNIPGKCEQADDPLGRKIGEYLWPEWFDADFWRMYEPRPGDEDSPSDRRWSALFQQRPKAESGNMFEEKDFNRYELGREPGGLNLYCASDYATLEDEGDNTEHGVAGLDNREHLYIVDWFYGQVQTDVGINELLNLAKKWNVRQGFGETGIIRQAIEPAFKTAKRQAGVRLTIEYLPTAGKKTTKALSFQHMVRSGKVWIPNCPWGDRLIAQLCDFPGKSRDDGVDVCGLFGRALLNMRWSRAKVNKQKVYGPVFGSWDWICQGTETEKEVKQDRVF
jgi:predicted phage terminase large subunit-like protein